MKYLILGVFLITVSAYGFFMDKMLQIPSQMMQQVMQTPPPQNCDCICNPTKI